MEFSNSKIKKFLIRNFSKKNFSYIFSKKTSAVSSLSSQKPALKKFLIFSQKIPQVFENGNPQKILMFQGTEFSYALASNWPRSKIFSTFPYK